MKTTGEASMKITGRAEDLLALALLFPDGAYPGVAVHTAMRSLNVEVAGGIGN